MFVKIKFNYTEPWPKNRTAQFFRRLAGAVFHKAGGFTEKLPVPAALKKHLSKKDIAFIAAAYAIPLPGTALFAASIVGSRHGFRHLRNRLNPSLIINASNG